MIITQFDVFDLSFNFFITMSQTISVINRSGACYFLHASNQRRAWWRVRVRLHASNGKDSLNTNLLVNNFIFTRRLVFKNAVNHLQMKNYTRIILLLVPQQTLSQIYSMEIDHFLTQTFLFFVRYHLPGFFSFSTSCTF